MTFDFTVRGSTLDELREAARAIMESVAPGREPLYLSFEASVMAANIDGTVRVWEARVVTRVTHGLLT